MSRNKKLIPELRFPEFKNDGDWKEKALETLANRIVLKNKNGRIRKVFTNSAAFGIVDQRKYFDKDIANKSNLENYYVVKDGDYIYNPRISSEAPVGPTSKNKTSSTGVMSPLYTVFRFLSNENQFYEYYFISKHWYDAIRKVSNTGARFDRMSITDSIFMSIPVLYPEPKEQQKISSCLSSLDEVIEAHSQKLELLKNHKKGLIQNLFPQEGEKVPKFRFPEFEKDKEWVEKSFEEVYDFKVTNSFSRALLNYEKGIVKNIHYGDIHTKFKTLFDLEKEDVPFINPDISIENIDEENYCLVGDIVFADASEDVNDIGKSIELTNLNNQRLLAGLHTLLARQKQSDLSIGFGGYLFKSDWIRKQIQKEAQGAKVLGISKTRINNISISFPKNKKEQQKIASCLSALDELIAAEANKIEQLQQHKKGLMQGLFPKIEN
ncbi:MAG: restriction endonuclease subunit S [Flavobacteriaceae bacterium]|nr:restriction endonuclease subunit S [Flavobacteriaceae bacterium]